MKRLFTSNDFKERTHKLDDESFIINGFITNGNLNKKVYRFNKINYPMYWKELENLKLNFRPFTKKAIV